LKIFHKTSISYFYKKYSKIIQDYKIINLIIRREEQLYTFWHQMMQKLRFQVLLI